MWRLALAAALALAAPLWTQAQTANTVAFQSSRKLVCNAGGSSGSNGGSGSFAPSPGGLSFPSTPFGLNIDTFNSRVVVNGDVDNDGDPDVLHAYLNRTDARAGGIVEWWENVGGGGSAQFARRSIAVTGAQASPSEIHDAALADVDSDGDLDVVLLLYLQTAYVARVVVVFVCEGFCVCVWDGAVFLFAPTRSRQSPAPAPVRSVAMLYKAYDRLYSRGRARGRGDVLMPPPLSPPNPVLVDLHPGSNGGDVVVMWLANGFSADRVVSFSTTGRVMTTRSLSSPGGPSVSAQQPALPSPHLHTPRHALVAASGLCMFEHNMHHRVLLCAVVDRQLVRMVLDDVDANGRVDVVFTDSINLVWLVNTAGTSGPRFTAVSVLCRARALPKS